jgi:NAD(P)-dependent dehydrogenase (short-subunit alcohol dehydrogenase family)
MPVCDKSDYLAGKTALVTGGAQRLGAATVRALAAEGANVVIHYNRSQAPAERLAHDIQEGGTDAWTLRADLARSEEVDSLIPRSLEVSGKLDILINNASIFPADSVSNVKIEDLVRNIRVNAWAPFVLSRSFARHANHGAIVNFLDTRVADYDWKHVSYILSKNMLGLLTRMTALEFAPNVRVNAVAPGLILPPPGKDESYLEAMKDTVPLKRHGGAEDTVAAVLFLLRSEFVTGQVVYVDGGRHLMEYASGQNPD